MEDKDYDLIWITPGIVLSIGGMILFFYESIGRLRPLTLANFFKSAMGDANNCPLLWLSFTALGLGFLWIARCSRSRD